ncbi:hypothetical protein EDC04DRAFT_2607283 [Pisolithus marmoratus]|nr:hypothetical protein EDC04DRAFT_2607283 [Pisolithus marmoratus]
MTDVSDHSLTLTMLPKKQVYTPPATSVLTVIDNNIALLDTCDSIDQELDSLPKTSPTEEVVKELHSKAVKTQRTLAEVENAVLSEPTPDIPIKVLYNVLIFPASEPKKDDIKKQKGMSSYFKLDSDKLYDM